MSAQQESRTCPPCPGASTSLPPHQEGNKWTDLLCFLLLQLNLVFTNTCTSWFGSSYLFPWLPSVSNVHWEVWMQRTSEMFPWVKDNIKKKWHTGSHLFPDEEPHTSLPVEKQPWCCRTLTHSLLLRMFPRFQTKNSELWTRLMCCPPRCSLNGILRTYSWRAISILQLYVSSPLENFWCKNPFLLLNTILFYFQGEQICKNRGLIWKEGEVNGMKIHGVKETKNK